MRQKITTIPFRRIISIGFIVWAVTLAGCSAEEEQPSPSSSPVVSEAKAAAVQNQFRTISGVEAQSMINHRKDLLVLDVRTPQERHQVRLADSQFIPIGEVMRGRLTVPKEQPILVVCAVGGRSYVASRALLAMGHQEVYNLEGGIEAWRRAQLPVEKGPEELPEK